MVPALVGVLAGEWLRTRMSAARFRKWLPSGTGGGRSEARPVRVRTAPGANVNGAVRRTAAIDATDARRRYRAELEAALACAGGKTRKRTFTRMVEAVSQPRGGALGEADEAVMVWSDLVVGVAMGDAVGEAIAGGHYPPGATTIERIAHLEQG